MRIRFRVGIRIGVGIRIRFRVGIGIGFRLRTGFRVRIGFRLCICVRSCLCLRPRADRRAGAPRRNRDHPGMRSLALLVVVLASALCGCPPAPSGTDAATDGVCCAPSASPCSRPTIGGWAPSEAECPGPIESFDGVWAQGTDERGCAFWRDVLLRPGVPGEVFCGLVMSDAGVDAPSDAPSADAPTSSACEMLGGTCALPMSPMFTVSCPAGSAAIPGSETGLGGYLQLGCGASEAGPLACCVPTFDCGGTECPVTNLCIGRFDRTVDAGPPVHSAECIARPASCESLTDCAPGACGAHSVCIAEVCMTPPSAASISGSTLECGT